jgi:hypothetical protein
MSLLKTWQNLGVDGAARLVGIKQYYEIQIYCNDPPNVPQYMRRRITLATITCELDYRTGIPGSIFEDAWQWLEAIGGPQGYERLDNLAFHEVGNSGDTHSIAPPDDDEQGSVLSGYWAIEQKEIQCATDGSATVLLTVRNEGPWRLDAGGA